MFVLERTIFLRSKIFNNKVRLEAYTILTFIIRLRLDVLSVLLRFAASDNHFGIFSWNNFAC